MVITLILLIILTAQAICQSTDTLAVKNDKETPWIFGPLYMHFPRMDSLLIAEEEKSVVYKSMPAFKKSNEQVLSTGSVYRAFSVSPFGGSEMTGGLQLQIQGQLSENMQVSGVLSDETSPLQPEGDTQSLEEIDQVYLQVSHPQFQMDAGDITMDFNHGKYMNISKRLIGLKNNFNIGKWSGSTVFAGSKGHYRQVEFKGDEGKQGPYFLDSEAGNRNIVIQAGTERVWLDGTLLSRGENHDYIIDYATAEVYFSPVNLIHSDSDILIEYQYSDFQYSQNVMAGTMSSYLSDKGAISFAWINENDQTKGSALNLSNDEIELLNSAGDEEAYMSGAIEDSAGDYIFVNQEYFVYNTEDSVLGKRYSVTFINDNEHGEYRRSITATGEIYYMFVPEAEREQYDDLYSSMQRIVSPKGHQLFEISGQYHLSENAVLDFSAAASDLDKNRLSPKDDDDNTGLAYSVVIANNHIHVADDIKMRFSISTRNQDERFSSMQRDRSALFYNDWNVNILTSAAEAQHDLEAGIDLANWGKTAVGLSKYNYGDQSLDRIYSSFQGGRGYIPYLYLQTNDVTVNKGFFRTRTFAFDLLPGKLHPFYLYVYEEQQDQFRFDHQTVGLKYAGDNWQTSLGIGERTDQLESDSAAAGLEKSAEGIFGSFDLKGKSTNGWSQEVTIHRRIKDDLVNDSHYNFTLGRIRTSFRKPQHPLRWDLKATMEETFAEKRTLVYDSVGVGLGDFRYDEEFNEYVSDPNGEYIAYTIFTGDRQPATKLDGLQLLEIDFSKTNSKALKNVSLRSELRSTIEGYISTAYSFISPGLGDTTIFMSKWSLRNEMIYKPRELKKMIKVWHRRSRNLDGLDSRGQDLKQNDEAGIEYRKTVFDNFTMEYRWKYHNDKIESTVSELRERSVNGHWFEGTAKIRVDQWQFDMGLKYGIDHGFMRDQEFTADAVSLSADVLKFVGTRGRIQSRFEWYHTEVSDQLDYLPPESLNGLAQGITLRSNLQGQWLIGRGFSLNLSMNYISDQRYDNFLTLNGEVRAYF